MHTHRGQHQRTARPVESNLDPVFLLSIFNCARTCQFSFRVLIYFDNIAASSLSFVDFFKIFNSDATAISRF